MFTSKCNVLQLIALLKSHNVQHVVLCPGSRNIPLLHSIANCEYFKTYAVTDERSAGFFALGLCLQTQSKVAVVVTSGSALLNLHPAVSEAFYQQLPLLVISADRPMAWLGQMDGQTLPQANVFGSLVKKSIDLPDFAKEDAETYWCCNRLINEALLALDFEYQAPVHINIQIREPFFDFSVTELKKERVIHAYNIFNASLMLKDLLNRPLTLDEEAYFASISNAWAKLFNICYRACPRVILVIGQGVEQKLSAQALAQLKELSSKVYCFAENITNLDPDIFNAKLDLLLAQRGLQDQSLRPQAILSFGGHIISKRLKQYLRKNPPLYHYHISEDGNVVDLFQCLTGVIKMPYEHFINALYEGLADIDDNDYFSLEESSNQECCTSLKDSAEDGLLDSTSFIKQEQQIHNDNKANQEQVDTAQASVDITLCQHFYDITSQKEQALNKDNSIYTYTEQSSLKSSDELGFYDDSSLLNGKEYVAYVQEQCKSILDQSVFSFSQMSVIGKVLQNLPQNSKLHLANSSTVRYAQFFKLDPSIKVFSNRGVNGIEGSLSTALGFAAAAKDNLNFILIGDLSFFYDMNALWQDNNVNNVRILLLNNASGEIFHALPGLNLNDKSLKFVTAPHNTSAKGWAQTVGYQYLSANNEEEFMSGLLEFTNPQNTQSILFEVFTDKFTDIAELKAFFKTSEEQKTR